jgi:protein-L-isoaspartate(D-aspartate) O-methyltransferase
MMGRDDFKHKGLRRELVNTLIEKGISEKSVLQAIGTVPRHFFLDSQFEKFAYQDIAFKIGAGQTISQPLTVARQSELLQVEPGMKVLEVGTGSGYQCCILLAMGAKVFSIERQRSLFEKTKTLLPQMGFKPKLYFGDGYKGLPLHAPFDRIIITCGAPEIPEALVAQLANGGIMVVPVGENVQTMEVIRKDENGIIHREQHGEYRFVPMLPNRQS